jgi:hypothetical protein
MQGLKSSANKKCGLDGKRGEMDYGAHAQAIAVIRNVWQPVMAALAGCALGHEALPRSRQPLSFIALAMVSGRILRPGNCW